MTYGDIYKLQDEKVIEKKSGTCIFPLRAVARLIFSLIGVVADWK